MADETYNMNKQRGRHMAGEPPARGKGSEDVDEESGQHHMPHIHIHSHSKGHTVHIMHPDGRHEKHEHAHGDAEGIAEHIHQHLGGGEPSEDQGQDEEDLGLGV